MGIKVGDLSVSGTNRIDKNFTYNFYPTIAQEYSNNLFEIRGSELYLSDSFVPDYFTQSGFVVKVETI